MWHRSLFLPEIEMLTQLYIVKSFVCRTTSSRPVPHIPFNMKFEVWIPGQPASQHEGSLGQTGLEREVGSDQTLEESVQSCQHRRSNTCSWDSCCMSYVTVWRVKKKDRLMSYWTWSVDPVVQEALDQWIMDEKGHISMANHRWVGEKVAQLVHAHNVFYQEGQQQTMEWNALIHCTWFYLLEP